MDKLDRLFGKQITNLLDVGYLAKNRNYSRVSSKIRGLSIDYQKKQTSKNLSITSKPEQLKLNQIDPLTTQQCVPEYFQQCLRFMLGQQRKIIVDNYMEQQKQINETMRRILVDWLIELHSKFRMFSETIFTVVNILDRYLSKKNTTRKQLQLVGIAALYIAAKYQQTYQVPQLRDLIVASGDAYTKHEILEMQADIINELNFDLIVDSSFKFFEPLSKLAKLEPKNHHLTQYVLQLSLLDMKFMQYPPSIIASSAIYLINKIRKRSPAWSDLMIAATGYEESQLKTCARQLCHLLQEPQALVNWKALKRKFSSAAYHEVTKIRLQRRQKPKN